MTPRATAAFALVRPPSRSAVLAAEQAAWSPGRLTDAEQAPRSLHITWNGVPVTAAEFAERLLAFVTSQES